MQATDAILKKTRDTMIGARNEWVSTTLLVDEEIRASAVEDADVGEQRVHNVGVIKNMKLVLGELAALADVAHKNSAASSSVAALADIAHKNSAASSSSGELI